MRVATGPVAAGDPLAPGGRRAGGQAGVARLTARAASVRSIKPMRIGEGAQRAGVKTSLSRYYEQIGLLPPAGHAAGQRRYDDTFRLPLTSSRLEGEQSGHDHDPSIESADRVHAVGG